MSKPITETIYKNSLNIYDALKKGSLKINKLYNIIKTDSKKDLEKVKEISKKDKDYLERIFTKDELLDEIIFLTGNRYKHLKGVRDMVNLDNLMNFVFTSDIYLEKVKVHYTTEIINLILEHYYDFEDVKILSKCMEDLLFIEKNLNTKIADKIDEYYILLITK